MLFSLNFHATELEAGLYKHQVTAVGTPPSVKHFLETKVEYFIIPGSQGNFSTK
jgi:hypothetical protein